MKEVSLNLSLSSSSLKDLMEILDFHRHQIVQSLALLSSLACSKPWPGLSCMPPYTQLRIFDAERTGLYGKAELATPL